MNLQSHLALSYYKEIAILDKEHNISIVQHRSSGKIYVKKELHIYNSLVYQYIFQHPIPNIPRIYEMIESDGILTIIEEYISGNTLSEYLEKHGKLTSEEVLNIFLSICKIVSSLHNCSPPIIHRDIKPSNIIITESKDIYLLDINAAKQLSPHKTEDTTLLGTHGYAAPEQYGFGSSDQHTDIYALGILFNQMLSGSNHKRISNEAPFGDIIRKCTQLDASLRYNRIENLIKDVERRIGKKKWNTYLPPGFRSADLSHIFAAIPVYPLLFFVCMTMEIKGATTLSVIIQRIILACCILLIIAFTFNYCNIQRFFFFLKKDSLLLSFIGIIIIDLTMLSFTVFVLSVIETLSYSLL